LKMASISLEIILKSLGALKKPQFHFKYLQKAS
jgi:hypothetical protein